MAQNIRGITNVNNYLSDIVLKYAYLHEKHNVPLKCDRISLRQSEL